MGLYDELQKISSASPTPHRSQKTAENKLEVVKEVIKKENLVDQPIDQSTNRPINQSMGQSTHPLVDVDELGPVVEKPRAFYITQKVDRWLDDAVRYLQGKGLFKVDRSILINALVHDPDLFKPTALDNLRGKLLAHLTNKSLKRI